MLRAGAVSLLIIIAVSGCGARLAPWERGNLAKPHMALEPHSKQAALRRSTLSYKEGAMGGYAGGGGGCGCN